MTTGDRRRELRAAYEDRRPRAGVYVLRNTITGRILLASTPDLQSQQNKVDFGRATESTGVLDRRLVDDARRHGMASFEMEVLDELEILPDMTPAQIRADLDALEALWRERLAGEAHY